MFSVDSSIIYYSSFAIRFFTTDITFSAISFSFALKHIPKQFSCPTCGSSLASSPALPNFGALSSLNDSSPAYIATSSFVSVLSVLNRGYWQEGMQASSLVIGGRISVWEEADKIKSYVVCIFWKARFDGGTSWKALCKVWRPVWNYITLWEI